MNRNSTLFYHLSIVFITLAGFSFLIASNFYAQEKQFAFKWVDEVSDRALAEENNLSYTLLTVENNRTLIEQSNHYEGLSEKIAMAGFILIIFSFIFIYEAYKLDED